MPVACRVWETPLPDAWRRVWVNYKHGRYTAEAIASRRWVRQCIREVREMTK
jgi:hypothetical protein